jgi:hypothetical protein
MQRNGTALDLNSPPGAAQARVELRGCKHCETGDLPQRSPCGEPPMQVVLSRQGGARLTRFWASCGTQVS